jgi:hypothetical protein
MDAPHMEFARFLVQPNAAGWIELEQAMMAYQTAWYDERERRALHATCQPLTEPVISVDTAANLRKVVATLEGARAQMGHGGIVSSDDYIKTAQRILAEMLEYEA